MAEFRVYTTLAYQIEPKVRDPEPRSDIERLGDNGVDCYVDLSEPRIVCMFEADTSRVSRSRQRFLAEYVADDRSELLPGVVREIRALETDASAGTWEIFDEQASNVVWEFDAAESRSLGDLGADLSLELVLEELLEEGTDLDLGITGYREAAVAVTHFVREIDATPTLAVSSNGRTSPLDAVDLVLKPGTDANFDPLDDGTKSVIASRLQDQKSRISGWYESTMREALDGLVDGDRTVWALYAELDRLERALSAERLDADDLRTEEAGRIVALVRSLRRNERPPNRRVNPEVLDASGRTELAEERQAVEENATDRSVERLEADLDALREFDRATEQGALRRARDALDAGGSGEFDRGAVRTFSEHVAELEDSDALDADGKASVREEIDGLIDDRLDEILANERDDLLDRFETWLDDEIASEEAERAVHLERAMALLDGERSSADDDAVVAFERLLEDVRTNGVLPEDGKADVRSTLRERIEAEIDRLRTRAKDRHRDRLSAHVADIADADASVAERYRRLGAAKTACRPGQNPSDRSEAVDAVVWETRSLRDHPLLDEDDAREVTAEIEAEIETEREALYDRERKSIEGGFRTALEAVGDGDEGADHARLHDELTRVEQYLLGQIGADRYPDRATLADAKEYIDAFDVRRGDGETILDQEDRESLRLRFQEWLTATQRGIRQDRLETLKGEIDDQLSAFREASFETENQIAVIDGLLEYHTTGSISSIDLPTDPDERRQQEIQDHVDPLSAFAGSDVDADGAAVLQEAERGELSRYFGDRLERLRETLSANLADSVEGTVIQRYDEAVVVDPDAEGTTLAEVSEAVDRLEELPSEIKRLCNGSITDSEYLDERTIVRARLLERSHSDRLRDGLIEHVEAEADRLKARRADLVRGAFDGAIESVVGADAPLKQKLVALSGIRQILRVGDADRLPIVDAGALVESRDELDGTQRTAVGEHIDSAESSLFGAYKQSVERTVEGGFRSHYERDDRQTDVLAEMFRKLLDEGEEDGALTDSDLLRPATRSVHELRELKPHLDTEQYQQLYTTIHGIAESYASDEPSGRFDRIAGKLPGPLGRRGSVSNAGWPSGRAIGTGLALLVVGVVIGVGIGLSLAGDGPLPLTSTSILGAIVPLVGIGAPRGDDANGRDY